MKDSCYFFRKLSCSNNAILRAILALPMVRYEALRLVACLILIYMETVQLCVLSLLYGVVLLAILNFNSLYFIYCTALVAFLINNNII